MSKVPDAELDSNPRYKVLVEFRPANTAARLELYGMQKILGDVIYIERSKSSTFEEEMTLKIRFKHHDVVLYGDKYE